ncbi:MAG TPA: tetratricopeptide repeat protein [Terracidiphilus sp.]|nr:tetratricopeptide repeat protein [Terracidiphilus sp.]
MNAAEIQQKKTNHSDGPDGPDFTSQELTGRLTEVALGYQRVLAANPHHPEALLGMSMVALASRQIDAAVNMAEAAVMAAPPATQIKCAAWVALGQALKADGRNTEAELAYEQAIQLDGMNSLARLGLGELRIAAGRCHEATQEFDLALRREPGLVAAHLGIGNALAFAERNEEALERYERALALRPRLPEAEYAAGFTLARLGRVEEAETRYRRALTQRPDFAAVWVSLGCLLREQGRDVYAEAALKRAIELRPDMIAGWINLAILERDLHRLEEAEAHLRKAFALNPDQVETLVAWCQFRVAEQDLAGAWAWIGWALARDPDNSEAMNMRGILLHTEGRFAEAVEAFERAETLGSKAAASNRGNSLLDMGRMDEALKAHETAVACDPWHPGALYNLALTRVRLGDWERGWQDYEARWRFREVHRTARVFEKPRWRGEALSGRRVLLHAEQGLGDTIQFCRYATLVVARGGTAILKVQEPAERLMNSLAVVQAGLVATARLGAPVPEFDLECPLMSLPAVFGTTVVSAPWPGAYLGADPRTAAAKRRQFPCVGPGLRVGLAWAGNPRYKADRLRSTNVATLVSLLRTPGFTWISLQKGEAAGQLPTLPGDVLVLDGSSRDRDLAETAALLATLDLVITTDTCIAHLAGAMGKPAWILLPHLADWRWMQERETTPWYPTARLFRQKAPGDWAELMQRVVEELQGYLRDRWQPAGGLVDGKDGASSFGENRAEVRLRHEGSVGRAP